MDQFYTYFGYHYNKVAVSGYRNGRKFNEIIDYSPFLFVDTENASQWRSHDNKPLERVDFKNIKEARNWIRNREEDLSGKPIYGLNNFPYVCIYERYKRQKPDFSKIRIGIFDIETDSEFGFGSFRYTGVADREIITIALKIQGEKIVYVLGLKDYKTENEELLKQGYSIRYLKCENERDLLAVFIRLWERLEMDVITGWHIEGFDIPYIISRITQVLGEDEAKRLSPFKQISSRVVKIFNRDNTLYELAGLPIMDSMAVYKKFSVSNSESYSLDYISRKVLNATKLDYSKYKTLANFYKEDFNGFVDYNIIDILRVEQIDQYLGFMNLVFTIAYQAFVNYADTLTTVRIWDIMIHNYLLDNKVAVKSNKNIASKQGQIAGGYVKVPQVGRHAAVMSFDFTSLYPHLTMLCNISPDTILGSFDPIRRLVSVHADQDSVPASVRSIIDGGLAEYHDEMVTNNVTISGRGNVFTREKTGFVPALMKDLFALRKTYTKAGDDAKKLLAKIETEMHSRGMKKNADDTWT